MGDTMASKVMLLLGCLALVDSAYHCNPDNRDCSCADFSYNECQAPVSNDNIHVLNLEECIFQCDLFHSFGACDWFRFDQTGGEDENCHLHGPGNEPMPDYLSSCNMRGRPTRDINEACYIDPTISSMADNFCNSESFCPGGCTSCNDDICGKIHETECTMEDEGTDNSASSGTEDGCNLLCTSLGANSNEISYLVWGEREEQCICYPVGKRFCNNIIMEWGVTLDDYNNCGYPNPDDPEQSQSQDAPAMLTAPKSQTFSATKQMGYANQAVTSTKTAVTQCTVTATMELLALVAVLVFATLDVGIREAPALWSKAVTEHAKSTFAHPRAHQR